MKRRASAAALLFTILAASTSMAAPPAPSNTALIDVLASPEKRAALAALVGPGDFGAPSSPAFVLLPNQPASVVHALTPHDLQANALSFFDGQRLRAGVAFDSRPLVTSVGSMLKYQTSTAARIKFGTVLSAGAVAPSKGSHDVIFGLGVRVPLIDRADPRRDPHLLEKLSEGILNDLRNVPDDLDKISAAAAQKALDQGQGARQDTLKAWREQHWNKLRWDFGVGGAGRSTAGSTAGDSVFSDRAGLWTALSGGLSGFDRLTVASSATFARADSVSQETSREFVGSSLEVFLGGELSLRAEVSKVWSKHDHSKSLDEDWGHFGGVMEWYVPEIKGWLGLGYGGDSSHRTRSANAVQLTYAFYRDRILTH